MESSSFFFKVTTSRIAPQSVAVGSKEFVDTTKKTKLSSRVKGRSIIRSDKDYCIREQQASYITDFANKNAVLSDDKTYQ